MNLRSVKRGDIFYADLDPVVGHEQGGIRPVLILQNDIGNFYSPTTMAAPLTGQSDKKPLPTHIKIPKLESGLKKDSIALLEQIRTIDKRRLREKVGHISDETLEIIDRIINLSLGVKEVKPVNELIRIEAGEIKLDSRMIAEHFEKAHSDVLKDIRDEIGKLENAGLGAEGIFPLGSYQDKNGQARPCYEMTEEGALQLAARYDAVARRKLIIKIKELKERGAMRLPRTYSEALRELADKAEENERLTHENLIMQPKAEYFDDLVERNLLTNFRDTAKELKVKESKFIDWLLMKYCYRDQKGKIKPRAEYVPLLFELKEFQKNGHADNQTLITPRGRETFRLLLINGGQA